MYACCNLSMDGETFLHPTQGRAKGRLRDGDPSYANQPEDDLRYVRRGVLCKEQQEHWRLSGGKEGGREDGVVVMPFEQTEVGKRVNFGVVRALEREMGREGPGDGFDGSSDGGGKGGGEDGQEEGGKKEGCQEGGQWEKGESGSGGSRDLRKQARSPPPQNDLVGKEGEDRYVVRLVRTAGEWRACECQGAGAERGHSAGTSSGGQHVCVKKKGRISMQTLLPAAAKMQG
jgi:hypothetical protein